MRSRNPRGGSAVARRAAIWLGALLVPGMIVADEVPLRADSADRYQNFVVNWPGEQTPLCAIVRTADDYATLFHPAPVIGARKPFAPAEAAFGKQMLVVVARVVPGDAGTTLSIEKVERTGAGLVVHCRSTAPSRPSTFTVKQTAIAWIPRGEPGPVRFLENGRQVAALDLASGTWVAPPLAAPAPRD